MDWSLRSCSTKGHITYAPDEEHLRARLHVLTPAGQAWRCLRCATFVVEEPAGHGPAAEAPIVLRGRALRDAFVLRLLALERIVKGLLILGGAYAVLRFDSSQASLREVFERDLPAARPLADAFGYDLDHSPVVTTIRHVLTMQHSTLRMVALGLACYALVGIIEGIGLWLMRRWGEYFAVVATSAFLPFEIYELTERVTAVRIGALVINLGALAYLLYSKRLFGLRGGHAAFERERASESLLEVEDAAVVAHGVDAAITEAVS